MLTFISAMALAAPAAPASPAPDAHAQHSQTGQMDHSKMDHSKMDHSKMAGDDCCKKTADGKMECTMSGKDAAGSAHEGHSGH